jgi:RNA polymerase sigma-70 factor (ECF subfamily)
MIVSCVLLERMRVDHPTTTALLSGLLDPAAEQSWLEFDARFRPIVRSFAMKLGLSEADADDVTQETLARFVKYYRQGKYDRARGRLSSWLIAIAHNCIADVRQRRVVRKEHRGESAIADLSETNSLEALWDEESRRAILAHAMRELRETTRLDPRTIAAFEMLAFNQTAPADVAAEMGMSVDSVYAAKNRCLTQLREILARLNQVYEVA